MRPTADELVVLLRNLSRGELEQFLSGAGIAELMEAASRDEEWKGEQYIDFLVKESLVSKILKEKLIEILQATSTGYLVDELLHRIDGAIGSVDIYTLHDIDSEIKRASRALTEKWPGDIEKDRFEWSELLRARRRKEIRERKPEGLRKPKNCPKCGRQKIKRILYGYPAPAGLYEPDLDGIKIGGCVIRGEMNDWFCASCGHSWYDPDDPARIERDKAFKKLISRNVTSDSPEDVKEIN